MKSEIKADRQGEAEVLRKMKIMFIAVAVVVIYKVVLDNLILHESEGDLMVLDMLRNIGNIVLIIILTLSIRDTVKNMEGRDSIGNLRTSKTVKHNQQATDGNENGG